MRGRFVRFVDAVLLFRLSQFLQGWRSGRAG
jgi:hypothetical protein